MPEAPAIIINLPGYPFQNLPSVATITALRTMSSAALTNGQDISVDAAVTAGDGLGGLFSWNAASTATDDGYTVVKPDDKTGLQAGRWLATTRRVTSEPRSSLAAFQPFLTWVSTYNQATAASTLVYDFGSSVGNGAALGAQSATQNPGAYFYTKAKAFFDPLNIFNMSRINGSVDGSALVDMNTLWAATIAPAMPKMSFGVPGMNDFQIAGFNTGESFDPTYGSPAALRAICKRAQNIGCTLVLSTTPHPHVGRISYSFFSDNPAIAQVYPTAVAAPVPAGSVVPTAANSKPFIPWKGASIQVDARFLRGNDMIRRVAIEFGCPLIDAERKQFDLLAAGYTYDQMYDVGEIVHPNLWTIQNTYHAAIDNLFDGMRDDAVLFAPPAVVGPRFAVNSEETLPVALRVMADGADNLLLLEQSDGTDAFTIDAAGTLNQAVGASATLAPIIYRRSGRDPGMGVPRDGFGGAANTGTVQSVTVPANSHGYMMIGASRNDLGKQTVLIPFYSDATNVTVGTTFGTVGSPVTPIYTVGTSGLSIQVTPTAINTSIKLSFNAW